VTTAPSAASASAASRPPRAASPQIEVTFDIDANGIVHVSAKDKATGKESKITITANSGLNEQQIQDMVAQAAKFEAEDKKRREAVESRNSLEALIIQTEKLISENGDKLPAEPKAEVEAALKDAKDVLESKDTDRINAAKEKLTKASHKLAQAAYGTPGEGAQQPGGPGDAGPGPGAGGGDKTKGAQGDVIDAEFEEKN
jgi:molecular chaperone DnaK